ncbi:hypothetical protein PFICI_11153 [Pestalotiopsis fici W106-1]|uniref:Beta-lactamase-related domain-containing protein n=1 Tax=Pestalotiopsis fici (strain W106-1 / CGMCC3.15140) TaxID=1229662 RepID=W3WU16_PESFW|nr:uncharacterized protein PFICI_11153 [Pestalotiopsis fici W106-1]ETS77279.1 hypothetical protein PFICI_11153 [Pestalotiopsis fici W106-1]
MVNQQAQEAIQKNLDGVTGDAATGIPGLVFVAVGKDGQQIAAVSSGKKGIAHDAPMDLDTVFWLASCTKLLAAIACMQAVEEGAVKLDDAEFVYQHCPELQKVQVIGDDGKLHPKKTDITLRMLLSHTSGFAYEFFNTKLRDFGRPIGYDVFHGDERDILRMPLVHEPGTTWEYGVGIDWAGLVLERATGTRLNDWIQTRIMQPLGLSGINMFPTDDMKRDLAYMHQKWPGSSSSQSSAGAEERDHMYREPLLAETEADKARLLHSGGAGAFGRPRDYVQVLVALLNDGTHPNGAQILKRETVEDMWKNQVPDLPNFARQGIPAAKSEQTNPIPELYPQEGNPPQGHGISFMLTMEPGMTGRGKDTAWWAGIANLFWWCDREKGVAGMIASQVMPFADGNVLGQWIVNEGEVYKHYKS